MFQNFTLYYQKKQGPEPFPLEIQSSAVFRTRDARAVTLAGLLL